MFRKGIRVYTHTYIVFQMKKESYNNSFSIFYASFGGMIIFFLSMIAKETLCMIAERA